MSFYPSENLENSMLYGKKFEGCSSCSCIYTGLSAMESVHIYSCRCELIFILYTTGIPEPSDKECQEGSHSLCIIESIISYRYEKVIINNLSFDNYVDECNC